ncbi:MAG: hypothetical protein LBK77_08135 [Spirochaetaceae bacterium]|jgi:hypothetical protein|nr:hypothetical protein [Spirochaetaceae bacterium]
MLQVYFLSIFLNGLLGYLLAFGKDDAGEEWPFKFNSETLWLIIGVLSCITGVLKILSPVTGNVPVVGDLVPALSSLAGGFILIFEFYRRHSTITSMAADRLGEIIEKNRRMTGFICLGAAALHFIFSSVLFL